jgi:hypothetical protein
MAPPSQVEEQKHDDKEETQEQDQIDDPLESTPLEGLPGLLKK